MLPDLETRRLTLRPLGLADLDDWLAMDLDPLVEPFISSAPLDPETHREALYERLAGGWPKEGGVWAAGERARPGFLGWCGLFPLEGTGPIEIGYRYRSEAWGRGIATEAAARILDYGFRTFEFDPIMAVSHPDNRASHRVLEKSGLVRQADTTHYGQPAAAFRLSRADYLASSKGQSDGAASAVTPSDPPRTP
jgi:RimJ/RimL family protein N-acetyltransferase